MTLRARLQRLENSATTHGISGDVSAKEIVRAGRWLEEGRRRGLMADEALALGEPPAARITPILIPVILEADRELREREHAHRRELPENTRWPCESD